MIEFHNTELSANGKSNLLFFQQSVDKENLDQIFRFVQGSFRYRSLESYFEKKVLNVLIEVSQNLVHHVAADDYQHSCLYVQEAPRQIVITTGNRIRNDHLEALQQRLVNLHEMDEWKIHEAYMAQLAKVDESARYGAGLGLYIMAMYSMSQFLYQFNPVQDDTSFFWLQVKVNKQ